MASSGIRRSRLPGGLAATIVAGILAGCAAVPSGNAPRQVLIGGNAAQAYVRPLPPPGPGSAQYATPKEVVLGFLAASASYAFDPAAAKQFLAPALRKTWRPGPVTVISSSGSETQVVPFNRSLGGSASALQGTSVEFRAEHLATLSQSGQYEYSPATTSTYTFKLAQQKNVWLITQLPQGGHSLMLTQASFQEVYQPRNLFFFAYREQSGVNRELVPDPVYAPVQSADSALNTDVAAGLVEGLLSDRYGWLHGATTTAFPAGTKLLKVTISGQVAVVNLGGAAVHASEQQVRDMNAQLLATLASKAYSSPLAQSVVLEINGHQPYTGPNANLVSPVSSGPLVYQSGGAVQELYPASTPVNPGLIGPAHVTAIAATDKGAGSTNGSQPVPTVAVATRNGGGCTVSVTAPPATGVGEPYHTYPPLSTSAGQCTSLSWDRNGDLWAVAGGRIWLLQAQANRWLTVSSPPKLPPDGNSGPRILSLQMAPDGVRAALLVATSTGNRVLLAAVVTQGLQVSLGPWVPAWSGLRDPSALSWYNAYELVVLTSTGIWQVPLTGGIGRLLGYAPAGAVSLASDGVTLVVGTAQGKVESSSTGAVWRRVALGTLPAYSTQST